MPELPEVEATRRNLERWSVGRRVVAVERTDEVLAPEVEALAGATFERWERRGKALAGVTDRGTLFSHLGMTGRWVLVGSAERRFQRLSVALSKGRARSVIAYCDARRLGDARLVSSPDEAFAKLGPDAWDSPLDPKALKTAMGKGDKATLKERLLEQKRVAGLGNIAVIEACFRARVHPHTPIAAVPDAAWKRLVPAIRAHFEATLAQTTAAEEYAYVSEGGDNPFLVYGREGGPCPKCKAPSRAAARPRGLRPTIARLVFAGRPTYFCPRCQPEALR